LSEGNRAGRPLCRWRCDRSEQISPDRYFASGCPLVKAGVTLPMAECWRDLADGRMLADQLPMITPEFLRGVQ